MPIIPEPVDPALRPLDREPVNVRAPFDERPTVYPRLFDREAALLEQLEDVELGEHDERVIRWLAGWDVSTVGAVVSLLERVRAAGGAR